MKYDRVQGFCRVRCYSDPLTLTVKLDMMSDNPYPGNGLGQPVLSYVYAKFLHGLRRNCVHETGILHETFLHNISRDSPSWEQKGGTGQLRGVQSN